MITHTEATQCALHGPIGSLLRSNGMKEVLLLKPYWPLSARSVTATNFTTWIQGSTPKEHREMLDRQWMQEQEEKRVAEDRDWRERERKSNTRWRLIELFILGILLAVATIVGAFIERSGSS